MPTTATFAVALDKYTADIDPKLGWHASGKFTLNVNPLTVIVAPVGAGCCSKGPTVISLADVLKIETIPAQYSQPGLLLEYAEGEEKIQHKFWVVPGKGKPLEEELSTCISFVLASKKLFSGEVLVAGALPTAGGAPVFFEAAEAQLINKMRADLLAKSPGASATIDTVSGVPGGKMTFERGAYAVKISYDTSAIAGEDEFWSVFCKPISSMEVPFPMVKVDGALTLDIAPTPSSKLTTMVSFAPEAITSSPHLWDKIMAVKGRAASSSIASRMSLRGPSTKPKKEDKKKKEEEPKEDEPVKEEEPEPKKEEPKKEEPVKEAPAEGEAEAAEAADGKKSARGGMFKGRMSLGGKKKKKEEAEPEPEPEAAEEKK